MLVIEKFYFNMFEFTIYLCIFCSHFLILLWFCMDQTLLLPITSLIPLVMPFLLYVQNHQKQSIPHWYSSPSIAHMVWFFKVLVSYYSQETIMGENVSEGCCSSRRNSRISPLHALHFLSTGTSKQDLSGMKCMAQKCTGLLLHSRPPLKSNDPLFIENFPAVSWKPKGMISLYFMKLIRVLQVSKI